MNKNLTKVYKVIKYRGRKFYLTENNISFMPGFRFKANGLDIISINKNLSKRDKQLQLHRLITGRGLRDIRSNRSANFS